MSLSLQVKKCRAISHACLNPIALKKANTKRPGFSMGIYRIFGGLLKKSHQNLSNKTLPHFNTHHHNSVLHQIKT